MRDVSKQKLIMVTGKGGVGKSTAAAALALREQKSGKKVLLVELGEESFFKDFFSLSKVDFAPTELRPGLDLAQWSSSDCLKEYALYLLKSESLYQLFFENIVMRTFIKVAPGLTELAILGKFTSGIRKVGPPLPYDVVVMDSFASGHTTALLRAPRGMSEAVRIGPMGEQSRSIHKVMSDSAHMEYYVVTLPEELPFQEATEMIETIEDESGLKPKVIYNKTLKEVVDAHSLIEISEKHSTSGIGPFAGFLARKISMQNKIQKRLEASSVQVHEVPLITEIEAWSLVEAFSERLDP